MGAFLARRSARREQLARKKCFPYGEWLVYAGHSSTMQKFDLAIGITVLFLQLVLACILLGRKLHRRLPFFFAYTLYSVLAAIVLAVVTIKFPALYYEVYWTTEFVYGLLGLLAIMEVFESVLALFGFEGSGWRFPGSGGRRSGAPGSGCSHRSR